MPIRFKVFLEKELNRVGLRKYSLLTDREGNVTLSKVELYAFFLTWFSHFSIQSVITKVEIISFSMDILFIV